MRKKTICTDIRCRKKHSAIGKVGVAALITVSMTGLTYPVHAFAEETAEQHVAQGDVDSQDQNLETNVADPVDEAKRAAGKRVYQAAKMVDAQIQNLPNLTTQQTNDFSNQVNSEVMKALASINATQTPDDAMKAGDAGVVAIEGVLKEAKEADEKILENERHEAIATIKKKMKSISNTIATSELPQAVKDSLTKSLNDQTDEAIHAIKSANSIKAIDNAKADGLASLDKVAQDVQAAIVANKPLEQAKKEAIEAVEAAGQKAHEKLDTLTHLTHDEYKRFSDMIDNQVKTSIDAINQATTSQQTRECAEEGVAALDSIVQMACNLDAQNAENNETIDPDLPKTFDASGLASGLAAAAGTILSALGIKSKK